LFGDRKGMWPVQLHTGFIWKVAVNSACVLACESVYVQYFVVWEYFALKKFTV